MWLAWDKGAGGERYAVVEKANGGIVRIFPKIDETLGSAHAPSLAYRRIPLPPTGDRWFLTLLTHKSVLAKELPRAQGEPPGPEHQASGRGPGPALDRDVRFGLLRTRTGLGGRLFVGLLAA